MIVKQRWRVWDRESFRFTNRNPFGKRNLLGKLNPFGKRNLLGKLNPFGKWNLLGKLNPFGKWNSFAS